MFPRNTSMERAPFGSIDIFRVDNNLFWELDKKNVQHSKIVSFSLKNNLRLMFTTVVVFEALT